MSIARDFINNGRVRGVNSKRAGVSEHQLVFFKHADNA